MKTKSKGFKPNDKLNNVIPYIQEGDYFFTKGVEAFYKRKFDLALKFIKKAQDMDPKEALYPSQMSIVYTEIGAYHAANQILNEVIEQHGDDYVDSYYLIANNYAHLGLLNEAQKYANLYMEKAPEGEFFSEAEQLLTVLDMTLEEEEEFFDDEDDLIIYQETAFYHLQHQNYKEARQLLEEALVVYPDFESFQLQYRYCLYFSGEKERALQLEKDYFEKHPHAFLSMVNLIVFYHDQGAIEKAKDLTSQLKNVHPIHQEHLLKIACSHAIVGELDEAYERFKSLSKQKVSHHLVYYRIYARVLYRLGEIEAAKQLFTEGQQRHKGLSTEAEPWLNISESKKLDDE